MWGHSWGRRGQDRLGSAASSPVARTTGCDGATSFRVGSRVLGWVWGAGGAPQVSGPWKNPPRAACTQQGWTGM